jgi:hypothetical protein
MSTLRIAVISSPRSGNTWVRSVLGDILGLQQFAVHNYMNSRTFRIDALCSCIGIANQIFSDFSVAAVLRC